QHVALNPQETKSPGIYICGAALGPKNIPYAVSSARAAAAAATAWTLSGEVAVEMMIPEVNEELCVGCRRCERTCPFGAIKVVEGKAVVSEVQCKGCGSCVASCPAHALDMRYYRDRQIIEEIKAAIKSR
ncbi:MAG: 4Fe-4S binding protein, partial [Candidatus Jordarchaeales archaeon]